MVGDENVAIGVKKLYSNFQKHGTGWKVRSWRQILRLVLNASLSDLLETETEIDHIAQLLGKLQDAVTEQNYKDIGGTWVSLYDLQEDLKGEMSLLIHSNILNMGELGSGQLACAWETHDSELRRWEDNRLRADGT